jgi:ATP citrate (pro-S)-lyase
MSAKAIREATGKELINKYLEGGNEVGVAKSRFASVTESTDWSQLVVENPWLETTVSILALFLRLLRGLGVM